MSVATAVLSANMYDSALSNEAHGIYFCVLPLQMSCWFLLSIFWRDFAFWGVGCSLDRDFDATNRWFLSCGVLSQAKAELHLKMDELLKHQNLSYLQLRVCVHICT